ncbi:WavE lipopolysaccharide synthesis family protein [Chromobacterium subtsugae]|uniref:WavE lipopolysaccharide synthesis family protein n=1 Tax=Chromobacterium subtsugae TaxID=251747 RepID=UPI0009BA78EE|nr:WavE lipopolysaccharide synthesis family protein [Chromobacterium subtsugae]
MIELSIVFQGSVSGLASSEIKDLIQCLSFLRAENPSCEIILSTWKNENVKSIRKYFDTIVFSEDPGAMPGLKKDGKANNVNRLILSSQAGVNAANGKLCVKLRSDLLFYKKNISQYYHGLCNAYGEVKSNLFLGKIVVCNLFTIDPRFVERMPYHMSDWIQIGFTDDLKKMWNIPLYRLEDALYFNFNKHKSGSTGFERQFQSRYAAEQYLQISGVKNFDFDVNIAFHNDSSPKVVREFFQFMLENYVVRDLASLHLITRKYANASSSIFYNLLCISEKKYDLIYSAVGCGRILDRIKMGGVTCKLWGVAWVFGIASKAKRMLGLLSRARGLLK